MAFNLPDRGRSRFGTPIDRTHLPHSFNLSDRETDIRDAIRKDRHAIAFNLSDIERVWD
jgi:hypothetical protein